MGIVSGIVVYLCIWWTLIFCILPIGVSRNQAADGNPEAGDPGAPIDPKIKQKFIATTLVAGLIWIIVYVLIDNKVLDFREMAEAMAEVYK